ncbi:MAG: hypothetical protein KFB95_02050 [Simkaniaceae bacterium]|nr:MAG: hypothetical protein KFB95_02050 [Simkaniaceae bacterium]
MSIEAIDSDINILNLGVSDTFPIEANDEAVATYQDPGAYSGTVRLVEEERLQRAISPNLREDPLKKKCALLEKRILDNPYKFYHDTAYLKMAEKLAPQNPQLAKEYVAKLEFSVTQAEGYIMVSKFEDGGIARETLTRAKWALGEGKYLYPKTVIQIYEEEQRRGFVDSDKTLEKLYQQLIIWSDPSQGMIFQILDLARFELKYQKPELPCTLHIAYEMIMKKMGDMKPLMLHHYLSKLGKYVGEAKHPLANKVMMSLRESIQNLLEHKSDQEYFPGQYGMHAWKDLIVMQAQHPYYFQELKEDFPKYLLRIQALKEQYPKHRTEYDFSLYLLVMDLAKYNLSFAKEARADIKDSSWNFQAAIEIFQNGKGSLEEFESLETRLKAEFSEDSFLSLRLFTVAADAFGLERAMPLLESAKDLALAQPEDSRHWVYQNILEVENKYNLESRKETLKALYNCRGADLSHALLPIIEAELSLIGSN